MGDEVEARAQCVCDHLHRPDHPDRKLTDAKVRSTGNQTVPAATLSLASVIRVGRGLRLC
jgi:hypothetical protein